MARIKNIMSKTYIKLSNLINRMIFKMKIIHNSIIGHLFNEHFHLKFINHEHM
jgi:hypothetical protein